MAWHVWELELGSRGLPRGFWLVSVWLPENSLFQQHSTNPIHPPIHPSIPPPTGNRSHSAFGLRYFTCGTCDYGTNYYGTEVHDPGRTLINDTIIVIL